MPMTPPDRIYMELANFTSNKERFSSKKSSEKKKKIKTPNEEVVVDMIKNLRIENSKGEKEVEIEIGSAVSTI